MWPTSKQNSKISKSCSSLHPGFRARANVIRKCNDNGTWGSTDDSGCTALNDAIPTLIVSFKVNVSSSIAEAVAANVSLDAIILVDGNAQYTVDLENFGVKKTS